MPLARPQRSARKLFKTALLASIVSPFALFSSVSHADSPDTFVHLFEWKWSDIAKECEYLADKGYKAVQISPPAEHASPEDQNRDAWWTRYQTVSYENFTSRSGNESELKSMIQTCKSHGVDIYVDAVFNQMANYGKGNGNYGEGNSSAGRYYNSNELNYPEIKGGNYFNSCNQSLDASNGDYKDAQKVRNCQLSGMPDLNQGAGQTQSLIVNYLNTLIGFGAKGFRIDAAKHMWPGDLEAIYNQLNDKSSLYIFQEVLDAPGEAVSSSEYTHLYPVTQLGASDALRYNYRNGNINSIRQTISGLDTDSDDAVVFVDNHDNQRGHAVAEDRILNHTNPSYFIANVHMLAWPYGYPKVMSSYKFSNGDHGPPSSSSSSTCASGNYDDWKCEHRWEGISNMVRFRQDTHGSNVTNYQSAGNDKISFSRGSKGFVAINRSNSTWTKTFDTGLAAGNYCDVTQSTFYYDSKDCDGKVVSVDGNGNASISVPSNGASVIYIGSRICEVGENCEVPDVSDKDDTPNSGNGSDESGWVTDEAQNPSMYIRGEFNSWGAQEMTYAGKGTWFYEGSFDGGCFKFDVLGDWTNNYGTSGSSEDPCADYTSQGEASTPGGRNISAPSGETVVTFNEKTLSFEFIDPSDFDENDYKEYIPSARDEEEEEEEEEENSGGEFDDDRNTGNNGDDFDEDENDSNTDQPEAGTPEEGNDVAAPSSGGGGGGAMYWFLALLSAGLLAARRR